MKKTLLLLGSIILFTQCVDEGFFGFSSYGDIKSIEVSNQASQAVINTQEKEVSVEIPAGVDLTNITIRSLTISSFAVSDKNAGDSIDLSQVVPVNITAEDGTITNWAIEAFVAASNPQLPNSDFNLWYQTADGYYEPGESAATTVWGTGNAGTKLLGLYATTPLEIEQDNLAVKMETLFNGNLPASFGAPISAGSIFTGKFIPENIDLSDPSAAIEFGTPFAGRPGSFKIKYSFVPGAENKDKNGSLLTYGDACDIYILLEVRNDTGSKRLATAWFRSDASIESLTDLEVDFTYGELPPDAPDYAKPPDGKYIGTDSASFILPTHLTFVGSSSFDGNSFAGAVGSLLIVDDLELVYE